MSIDDIRIPNGAVRYSDERNGAWGRFDGLNAQFSLAAMDQPLDRQRAASCAEGETFEFKSTLTTPQDVAEERPAKLRFRLAACRSLSATTAPWGPTTAPGTITANSPSLSALAHWWGNEVSPEAGAGEVAFTGALGRDAETACTSPTSI